MTKYETAVRITNGEMEGGEFIHHHSDDLKEMGFVPVFFEGSGECWLLIEVES